MQKKLPRDLSSQDVIKALSKVGFQVIRQRGSHIGLQNRRTGQFLTVPNHPYISLGTLRKIIRQAGLEREEFLKLL